MNCIQTHPLLITSPHRAPGAARRWFWGCVGLSVTLHLLVVLAATGLTTRLPEAEKPEQAGIPVEFVINALPTTPAKDLSSQELPSGALEKESKPEEILPSKQLAEKKPAPTKNESAQRVGGNPTAAVRGEATSAPQGNPRPEYPDFARRKGWQGECLLRVVVSPEGRAEGVSVHRSSGYAILDQSAAAAVRRWKFLPRVVGGQRLGSTIELPVNFSLLDRS